MNASFRLIRLCVILAAVASAGRAESPAAAAGEPTFAEQESRLLALRKEWSDLLEKRN